MGDKGGAEGPPQPLCWGEGGAEGPPSPWFLAAEKGSVETHTHSPLSGV